MILAASALPTARTAAPAALDEPIVPLRVIAPAPEAPIVRLPRAPFVAVPILPVIVAVPVVFAIVNAFPSFAFELTVEVNSIFPPPPVITIS